MGIGSLFGFSSGPAASEKDPSFLLTPTETDSEPGTASAMSTPKEEGGLLTPATSTYPDETPKTAASTASYVSHITTPPAVVQPYGPDTALTDLTCIQYALQTFLESKMLECEAYMRECDPPMERLYFATGFGLIQCVKGLMSYADEDLLMGIQHTKQGNAVAAAHRKKAAFLGSRLAGYVVSAVHGGLSVSFIKSMTDLERHAELVYAESLFEKALLGIVYSGDWLAFIKEALNMRTTIGIYRALGAYLDAIDAVAPGGHDDSVDVHFRSGVYLGVGMSNIILSLMPGKLMALVELFGYHGDRARGLALLMKAGGWVEGEEEPRVGVAEEGVRRSICDMTLLIFHLVLSSFTFDGVDTSVAATILAWNLKRYPNGVFFLFGAGRLALMHSRPKEAVEYYTRAMESQQQYRNLHHISFWEMAIAHLALWDVDRSLGCWRDLEREATWSKAIYSYGMAVCLLHTASSSADPSSDAAKSAKAEAGRLMARVPGLRQKIAGKSIPMEKFVARKARKHQAQGRLLLPALDLAYIFQGIGHAPRGVIVRRMLPEVDAALKQLGVFDEVVAAEGAESAGSSKAAKTDEAEWRKRERAYAEGGKGYWDDYCLAMFLRGVCMRYVAYPDPDAELDEVDDASTRALVPQAHAARAAEQAFQAVFTHGPKIELDHHLVYHAHYEYGRLLANLPDASIAASFKITASLPTDAANGDTHSHTPAERAALAQFELVLSGKYLEVGPSGRKGRYSMENALAMRTHAAVAVLGKGGRL